MKHKPGHYPNGKKRTNLNFGRRKVPVDPTKAELEERRRAIQEYLEKHEVTRVAPGFSHMDW